MSIFDMLAQKAKEALDDLDMGNLAGDAAKQQLLRLAQKVPRERQAEVRVLLNDVHTSSLVAVRLRYRKTRKNKRRVGPTVPVYHAGKEIHVTHDELDVELLRRSVEAAKAAQESGGEEGA